MEGAGEEEAGPGQAQGLHDLGLMMSALQDRIKAGMDFEFCQVGGRIQDPQGSEVWVGGATGQSSGQSLKVSAPFIHNQYTYITKL